MTSDPVPRVSFPAGRSSDERDVLSPRPERGEGRDEAAQLFPTWEMETDAMFGYADEEEV